MSESGFRSRLKRKQCEDVCEKKSSFKSDFQSNFRSDANLSEGSAWWSRPQLPAEDRLWALALKSALPLLEDRRWDQVPDLPQPCAATAALELDERWGCDLGADVPLFPEALGASSSQQEVKTRGDEDNPGVSSPQNLGRREEEEEEEEESSNAWVEEVEAGQLQTHRSSPLQRDREHGQEAPECSAGGGGGGGGGGDRLQNCPMCLMVFPEGFTQMDCDHHLCQCLSDMNVDMTW